MKKLYPLFFLFIIPFINNAQQDSILFDFNDLQSGNLNGQNGWNIDFSVGLFAGAVGTLDNTHGVFYNSGGGGFGRTATQKSLMNLVLTLVQEIYWKFRQISIEIGGENL